MNDTTPLILYFSHSNTTRHAAQLIAQHTGGDLVEIKSRHDYPEKLEDAKAQVFEQNNAGIIPEIACTLSQAELTGYRTIYFGYPTWLMQLPPPVKTFVQHYSLANQNIIIFNTNIGLGIGESMAQLQHAYPTCTVSLGLEIREPFEQNGKLLASERRQAVDIGEKIAKWLG